MRTRNRRPPVRLAECQDCAAPIVFALLDTGKRIPLNPLENPIGNVACHTAGGNLHGFVVSREKRPGPVDQLYVPHFATCEERNRDTTTTTPTTAPDPGLF